MSNTERYNYFIDMSAKVWALMETTRTDFCIVCGRKTSNDWSGIEIGIDGFELGTTDETESQGAFKVGPECYKKVGK